MLLRLDETTIWLDAVGKFLLEVGQKFSLEFELDLFPKLPEGLIPKMLRWI